MKTTQLFTLIAIVTLSYGQALAQTDYCLDFDGVDDYVLIADVNDLGTSDFTLEAWIYCQDAAGVGQRFITKGMASVGTPAIAGYGLRCFDNSITSDLDFHIGHSDGSLTFVEYNGISVGVWHHIAAVRSNTDLLLYVDGVEVSTATTSVIYDVNTDLPLALGVADKGGMATNAEFWNGMLDEIRIWNVARTPTEIMDNMDCAITSAQPNLLAVYNFNENTGITAFDSSGYDNNGSFVSTPVWQSSPVAPICSGVGLEINDNSQIIVTPNPFGAELIVQGVEPTTQFTLFDLSGKIVISGVIENGKISTGEISRGNYILEIADVSGKIRKKIQKL